jgi:RNA 2',3'-cyclic 3'-phosphodiesterase
VREALVRWGAALAIADPALRPVFADSLHLTLCFLGERPLSDVDPIAAACARVAGDARNSSPATQPALELGPALQLPRRNPRVMAVRIEDRSHRLAHLQAALSDALQALGVYGPERRPFLPHVTVARVRRPQWSGPAPAHRGRALPRTITAMPFTAGTITLFESRQAPGRSAYTPLSSAFLDAPA